MSQAQNLEPEGKFRENSIYTYKGAGYLRGI